MSRAGLLVPVRAGFAAWLEAFRADWFMPQTDASTHWQSRAMPEAMAWVAGRMVDQVQDMLDTWVRNNNTSTTPPATPHKGTSARLPQLLICIANDFTPLPFEAGRQVTRAIPVTIPSDAKNRVLKVRMVGGEVRAQVVVFAAERETAAEIASQLLHYWADPGNRNFRAVFDFAGMATNWPVAVKASDAAAISTPVAQNNITVLSIDMTLQFNVPQFITPAAGQPNDGTGTGPNDPSGFPVADAFTVTAVGMVSPGTGDPQDTQAPATVLAAVEQGGGE